jgi:hypothetical protein
MSDPQQMPLVVLVPDLDMEMLIRSLLGRPQALGIREIAATTKFERHPRRDPGVFRECQDFLRSFQRRFKHALVLCDRHGCGREAVPRSELERDVEVRMRRSGWEDRGAAVVIDPELENWFWVDSRHVADLLDWPSMSALREWLMQAGHLVGQQVKPVRPKEALRTALAEKRKKPSSSLFGALARQASFERCTDGAFLKLWNVLRAWFPAQAA